MFVDFSTYGYYNLSNSLAQLPIIFDLWNIQHLTKECGKMDRRIIKTKEAIKLAYTQLLQEQLSSKITITEIAKRANIDRKTFYLHFESTEAVMEEILKDNLLELDTLLSENNSCENPIDVATIFECINTCITNKLDFYESIANRPDFEMFVIHIKEITIQKNIENFSEIAGITPSETYIYSTYIISGLIDI